MAQKTGSPKCGAGSGFSPQEIRLPDAMGKVEPSADMLAGVLERHLKEHASRHGLAGGTKQARDEIRRELQSQAVDMLDLPGSAKEELKSLLSIRILIKDNIARSETVGKANLIEMATILGDFLTRARICGAKILGEDSEETFMAAISIASKQIRVIESTGLLRDGAFEGAAFVLQAEHGGARQNLLLFALALNDSLIERCMQGEVGKFNAVVSVAMKDYVNVAFPECEIDLLRGMI